MNPRKRELGPYLSAGYSSINSRDRADSRISASEMFRSTERTKACLLNSKAPLSSCALMMSIDFIKFHDFESGCHLHARLSLSDVFEIELHPEGFEPPTVGSEDQCSIQLSYGCLRNLRLELPSFY